MSSEVSWIHTESWNDWHSFLGAQWEHTQGRVLMSTSQDYKRENVFGGPMSIRKTWESLPRSRFQEHAQLTTQKINQARSLVSWWSVVVSKRAKWGPLVNRQCFKNNPILNHSCPPLLMRQGRNPWVDDRNTSNRVGVAVWTPGNRWGPRIFLGDHSWSTVFDPGRLHPWDLKTIIPECLH